MGRGCSIELHLRTFVGLLELRLRGKVRHVWKRFYPEESMGRGLFSNWVQLEHLEQTGEAVTQNEQARREEGRGQSYAILCRSLGCES